jgi:hypothetical protein
LNAFGQAWTLLKARTRQTVFPEPGELVNPHTPLGRRGLSERRFVDKHFEQKLRERKEREPGLPARITLGPNEIGDDMYALRDEAGNVLSSITFDDMFNENEVIDYYGETPRQQRRKGYYRDLFENLLRHGVDITSTSRNQNSNPFHFNFLQNLPSDIDANVITQEDHEEGLAENDIIEYSAKPAFRPPEFGGDLVESTRIKYPLIDERPPEGPLLKPDDYSEQSRWYPQYDYPQLPSMMRGRKTYSGGGFNYRSF